ncbi:uncharacterized protein LOC111068381 [Drosophila obscura]|uniref:uncharacterized protein LOC111068381 n=1 Tax=Drosophila obscura TaxID=7282 RepID=UPI000BA12B5D|nr:uncharacterized protein LOC111068381 [Drosophila obscura]
MPVYPIFGRPKLYRPIDSNKNLPGHKSFTPSYEKDETSMRLLLSWHYGRQWLEESKQFHEKIAVKERSFIKPDIKGWVLKRMTLNTRRANNLETKTKPRWG